VSIAFWCIFAALCAPYVLVLAARSEPKPAEFAKDPRASSEGLGGWHRRAYLAHLNAFEAVPAIVAAVMVAELTHAPRHIIDTIAVAFVLFRALHAAFYIADKPMARSLAFRLSLACIVGLFGVAAVLGRAQV
jgi:uncharacterized MAPEG superfamily protein